MKILITGGAGFIGSHLQDAFLQMGHEVAVLDALISGSLSNLNPKARFYQMDIVDPEVENVFEEFRPEILCHHAAQMDVRRSVSDPKYDCQVNGIGTLNLLESGRKHGLRKVIFASTGGAIYGEQQAFPADESHTMRPTSPYGITKLLGEKYLDFYHGSYGLETVALRYANVYGPRQNPHGEAGVVAIFVRKLLNGEIPTINGDGFQTRDYVFIEDVVDANRLALKPGVQGCYNVGTGIETSVVDLYKQIAKQIGIEKEAQHGPAKSGEQSRSVISWMKINQELGWAPAVNLNQGLSKTVEFFRLAGKLA